MRVLERLEQLYAIGGGPGANRPHGSPAEDEAHELAATWMREAGLELAVDPVLRRRHAVAASSPSRSARYSQSRSKRYECRSGGPGAEVSSHFTVPPRVS